MKKVIVLLSFLTFVIIFQQCQTSTEINSIENKEYSNENQFSISNQEFVDVLLKNGGKILNQEEIESRSVVFCGEPYIDCSPEFLYSYDDMVMPGTCDPFHANGLVKFCDGSMIITDFYAVPCYKIDQWHSHLDDIGDDIGYAFAIDSFDYEAALLFEERIAKLILQAFNAYCPYGLISSEVFKPTCYRYCIWKEVVSNPGDEFVMIKMHEDKLICGANCCLRKRVLCLNSSGEIEEQSINFQQIGSDNCAGYQAPCEKGRLLSIDCEHPCGPPN